MDLSGFAVLFLNGLAGTSSLFMVACGLSLIFGVSRIVNFAHGSLYMFGLYFAYSLATSFLPAGPVGFWLALLLAALLVGALGAIIELLVLRRIYQAPELFQLLATFALVLVLSDLALWLWGPEDLLGPQAPGLASSILIFGRQFPTYNLLLILIGPLVLLLLWLLLNRTRWGTLIRAATQDRQMLEALGVNQSWLFTGVFALGAFLAGLGGALQLPIEPASLTLDLLTIGDAFAVVVIGGMGSIPGAFVAAFIIAHIKALCIGLGTVQLAGIEIALPQLTLVVEFLIMAVVLIFKPWGLFGARTGTPRSAAIPEAPYRPASALLKIIGVCVIAMLICVPLAIETFPYLPVLIQDILIAMLFAASLHFIMGAGGMHSFGHAAYYGVGAYAAALLLQRYALPMSFAIALAPFVAAIAALIYGWFCVRLSGIYLAMLTLAFAQITWSVAYQWNDVTGGSNGLIGIWPAAWLEDPVHFYYFVLAIVLLSILALRWLLFSPLGYALRASRDSMQRSGAIGIDSMRVQWIAFVIAGFFAGLAGALFVFSKGSISPEELYVSKSIDGLVMVLLGGIQSITGPLSGAAFYVLLHDYITGITEYWKGLFGLIILLLVLLFPQGLGGLGNRVGQWFHKAGRARPAGRQP
jgi:branched-chain amino acid transport system permease protein